MSKMIAVCGAPGSGKTTAALKIAEEIYYAKKGSVIFLSPDLNVPCLAYIFPNCKEAELYSVGAALDRTDIYREDVLRQMNHVKTMENFGFLGYKAGENSFSYQKGYFNQKISPYTQIGRDLYKRKHKKMQPLTRPALYDGETTLYKSMGSKIYNFEYFMNREYAYNRDKGKCKCCGEVLARGNRHCHHIKTKLSLDEINKVSNLAWLCINCHRKIHGKEPVQGLSSKTIKKIEKYIKSLIEVS